MRVLLVFTEVFKWQDRDRFIQFTSGRAREEKEPGRGRNEKAYKKQRDYVSPPPGRPRQWRRRPNALGRDVERPSENERNRKPDQQHDDDEPERPGWKIPRRKDGG